MSQMIPTENEKRKYLKISLKGMRETKYDVRTENNAGNQHGGGRKPETSRWENKPRNKRRMREDGIQAHCQKEEGK